MTSPAEVPVAERIGALLTGFKLPTAAAEYGMIRTYLEWILTLP